jgi:hypothetical protein
MEKSVKHWDSVTIGQRINTVMASKSVIHRLKQFSLRSKCKSFQMVVFFKAIENDFRTTKSTPFLSLKSATIV